MQKKDDERLKRSFAAIRRRQFAAIAITVISIIILAVISKRPDLFSHLSKKTILTSQLLIMWALVNFSAFNWRCPACKKYLGHDIDRRSCKKCGVRLR